MLGTITLTVGQPDGVSVPQKEDAAETMEATNDEVCSQVNGNKVEKESPDANAITAVEEKVAEEKSEDASEVGFKKIFRFVGFKFTLKKDKSEEKEPVKLLTVKDKEDEDVNKSEEPTEANMENGEPEEEKAEAETPTAEVTEDKEKPETAKDADAVDEVKEKEEEVKQEEAVKEEEPVKEEGSSPVQETTLSPFRKLFNGGLFSNLRKKASIKKTKEDEDKGEAVEEAAGKTEETATAAEKEEAKEEMVQDTKEAAAETPAEEKTVDREEASNVQEEAKSETTPEPEATAETTAPAASTDETTQEEEKTTSGTEEERAPAEVASEAELLSSQEKAKTQGSPLKKLFTGAGLKKLSTKKQKTKKDTEPKLTESTDLAADSTEAPKVESGPSSPEDSGEHAIAAEEAQAEANQEAHADITSEGEKKKEGIIAWSSFKKLVTPKRLVKRSSESEDEAQSEKPAKSATLSSSDSAALTDKSVEEETKEEKPDEEEPKTETTEKIVSSTEEPKKKMDTSVSWEALMCMGGPKKRTRKTSDSDDEETKLDEESAAAAADVQEESAEIVTTQETETDGEVLSSSEPASSLPERESAWDTLKRVVMPKTKAKVDENAPESPEQVLSDSELPKDESSFSFKKFLTGRRKKKVEKQTSSDLGSGEEDSDTPAVVPLSEYNEQAEVQPEEPPTEPAAVQAKIPAEDRSPSWIPAVVEDTDDKHEELSDIPEEAETAATPKSVDTDVTEDESENDINQLPRSLPTRERRLSTAEVKPFLPAPAAETKAVPQGPKPEKAEEVIEAIEAQVNEIPFQTSVDVQDVPIEVASEETEYAPPTENAKSKTNTILEPHCSSEAMAICTGLGTKEIAKVAVEKPATTILENVPEVAHAQSTEVAQEAKTLEAGEATVAEDEVITAQVYQVETTILEPVVENSESVNADIQVASKTVEPQLEMIGLVSTAVQESETLQPAALTGNSPKVVVDSVTPTTEAAICTPGTEVTESTVEIKEKEIEVEQQCATVAKVPVTAVAEATCETEATMTNETEAPITVVENTVEVPVIAETVVLVAPSNVEPEQVETPEAATLSEPAASEEIEVQEKQIETESQQVTDLEVQSMEIAQTVILDAMDKVSEEVQDPKASLTQTSASTPIAHQAVAAIEEIEISTEGPIITDTPNVISCEKSPPSLCVAMEVTDSFPVEVTGTIDAVGKVENQPEEELKKAEEVQVSEETVVVEEVVEIQEENETKEPEQTKEEESKEDVDIQEKNVKEETEEVKPQLDEAKSEKPAEVDSVREVHMPVQVVLQTAKVMDEPFVEEEAVVELDSNGPVVPETTPKVSSSANAGKLPMLSEEPVAATTADTPEAAGSQAEEAESVSSSKCAEVMAQVIEVIEEAVKEIEPVSEVTAAS